MSLADGLKEKIRREGAITFREWMRAALYDEREGYYRRRAERWGRAGDYRTSPERSRLFASTFARYFADLFVELGRPREFFVVEAGGGAGDFARGVLDTLRRDAPEVFHALRYVFDETSADSRRRAAAALAPFGERVEFRPLHDARAHFEKGIVFSNELLDAFPVNRVRTRGGRLRELHVGVDEGGAFVWVEGELSDTKLADHFARAPLPEGHTAEVNLEAGEWVARAAAALGAGFVVAVDYGDDAAGLHAAPHRREGTLRAFGRHGFADDFLQRPGEVDLTTTVDWTHVVEAGERAGLRTVLLERQDRFLLRAGLLEQLERETSAAGDEAEVMRLRLEAREMILPGGMAEHFHVLVQKK